MQEADTNKRILLVIATAGTFLLALGLTLYPLISVWYNARHQSMIQTEYQQILEQTDDAAIQEEHRLAEEYNALLAPGILEEAYSQEALLAARGSYADRLNLAGNGIMGYVRIPKIQAVLPIYHGTSEATLELGVGHLLGSSLPIGGSGTHCVLTGHSGMASQKMFSDLPDLEIGDIFYLDVLGETLAYQVDQIETVLPHDASLLGITEGEDYCALVTCTPFGVNTHRLLVRGTRIPVPEESAGETEKSEEEAVTSTWMLQYLKGILLGVLAAALIVLAVFVCRRIYRTGFGGKYVRKD